MVPLTAAFLSITNLTSAGQFAGVKLIFMHAPWFEIAVTVLLINLRYSLMALSLSQHLSPDMSFMKRIIIGYGITDEIYAVAVMKEHELNIQYMLGLMSLPVIGWTSGTYTGALAGHVLPLSWRSALGIALYAMFVAIIMPPARRSRPVLLVVTLGAVLSVIFEFTPYLSQIPLGWRLILCTVIAASVGAILAPVQTAPVHTASADHHETNSQPTNVSDDNQTDSNRVVRASNHSRTDSSRADSLVIGNQTDSNRMVQANDDNQPEKGVGKHE